MTKREEIPIEQIVARAVGGSREALEEVVRRIQDQIYGLCLRMLFHPMEAEDASQEILIKVITNLKSFRFEGSFRGWVFRIASNHLKRARKCLLERVGYDYEKAQAHIDRAQARGWFSQPLEAPEALLEVEMRSACTQALLMTLDRAHRLVFILAVVMEVSSREGAEILDITPAAFRQRLSRGRRRVMDFLRRNCGLFDPNNACTCANLAAGRVSQGWLNPNRLLFASQAEVPEDSTALGDYMRELDELARLSAMFNAMPGSKSPVDFAAQVRDILETGSYRVFEERH